MSDLLLLGAGRGAYGGGTNTYTISTGADDGKARRNTSSSSNSTYNAGFSNSNAKEYKCMPLNIFLL